MSLDFDLKTADLEELLKQLQQQIRQESSNAKLRVFLFQLLSVMGNWDRALNQLNVAGQMDPSALVMVQAYREAIRCEILRQKVFAGKTTPLVFGEPEQWMADLIAAFALSAQANYAQVGELRQKAFEAAPAVSGSINGEKFEWIADADSRLGPVLEAVVNGRYYWIPFSRISKINLEAPVDLRDFVWMPTQFTWSNGGQAVGLIPSRYAGTETMNDSALSMGRKTQWQEVAEGEFHGLGQRILTTDVADYSLFDVRVIELNTESVEQNG